MQVWLSAEPGSSKDAVTTAALPTGTGEPGPLADVMDGVALETLTVAVSVPRPPVRVTSKVPSSVQVRVVRAAVGSLTVHGAPSWTVHLGVPAPETVPASVIASPSAPVASGPAWTTVTGSMPPRVGTTFLIRPSESNSSLSMVVSRWVPSPPGMAKRW